MLTRGHTTRVIFTVKICNFSDRTRKVISRKLKYIFAKKKNCTTIVRRYWATKYESRRETSFELLTPTLGWIAGKY